MYTEEDMKILEREFRGTTYQAMTGLDFNKMVMDRLNEVSFFNSEVRALTSEANFHPGMVMAPEQKVGILKRLEKLGIAI